MGKAKKRGYKPKSHKNALKDLKRVIKNNEVINKLKVEKA